MSAEPNKPSMNIDPAERGWMVASIILLVVFAVAVGIAGYALGVQVPAPERRVNPNLITEDGPFSEPGLREVSPGVYNAYILSQIWAFTPREIVVEEGAEVTFYVTSRDVQHGFKLQDTNVNFMIIPGQVSTLTVTFDEPGEYIFLCNEYCGTGHAAMFGVVTVEPK